MRLPGCLKTSAGIEALFARWRGVFQSTIFAAPAALGTLDCPHTQVAALCASLGSELDFEGGPAALSASLVAACAAAPPPVASLIKSLATRAMSEAEYMCTGGILPGLVRCRTYLQEREELCFLCRADGAPAAPPPGVQVTSRGAAAAAA